MELKDYRKEIDAIDEELVRLFQERMDVAEKIAAYKKEKNLPIFQPAREQEKLIQIQEMSRPEMVPYLQKVYALLFELSRSYQASREEIL